ncbi:molybdopterin-dependent oxidoreductase [Cupriavidus numazuensis]|uniref:Oxidoreductase molybdopterin-binding domain-containing protein n=1 Tax=Cupriavidus numazuensis TaxID=221992 RepID=A0ABM8TNU8_9BURK|nr:molybdopterin-dependent oxidoreductase [Cupriavidus numazuensis]CAG2156429.1 hypothetical protein LMG26411_05244 [Cupriavidus numazuensis]
MRPPATQHLHATSTRGGPSAQFRLVGAVARPATYDLAALQALPAASVTVGEHTYTGVRLWDLLDAAGLAPGAGSRREILASYVVATGSDGYRVIVALAEIAPDFGNQPDLVAYAIDGAPLTSGGFARLVVPNDRKGGRHVSNLVSLEVLVAPATR